MSNVPQHKICFLGYSQLYTLAKRVIEALPPSDVSYLLVDCEVDNQDEYVQEALNAGCTVFIAGPGNGARFQATYNLPLVKIPISPMDYAFAIHTAYESGCRKVGIVRYLDSLPLDTERLQLLLGRTVEVIDFESFQGLFAAVRDSDCDGIVGTAGALDAAEAAGKRGFLAYLSTDGIREACERAAELARDLWMVKKNRAITKTIMNNSQLGIIVTDTEGTVEFSNRVIQDYTGLLSSQLRGRRIQEFYPNLSVDSFIRSARRLNDSYRQIEGAMMRCVQEKLLFGTDPIGVVMTLYPGAHNKRQREENRNDFNSHIYQWRELTSLSPAMKTLISEGKALTSRQEPTVILGERGSGREEIAYCIHGSSSRSEFPCITVDLATLPQQDAARVLLGYEYDEKSVNGLLADANGGSVVLKNISQASPTALACLQHVLTVRQIYRPGMEKPVDLRIGLYTVCNREELNKLPPDLRSQLSIHHLNMPPLRERKEDVGPLFLKYLSQLSELPTRYALTPQMEALLQQYSWPGNVSEFRSVCIRYVIARSELDKPTPKHRYKLLLRAIGEDEVFQDLLLANPVLKESPVINRTAFSAAFWSVKEWMQYSNEQMAEKLNMGRTSLWRILRADS